MKDQKPIENIDGESPFASTLTLDEILQRSCIQGVVALCEENLQQAALPTCFPITVNVQSRIFLELLAKALNTSIAGLAGLMVDQVVANT